MSGIHLGNVLPFVNEHITPHTAEKNYVIIIGYSVIPLIIYNI